MSDLPGRYVIPDDDGDPARMLAMVLALTIDAAVFLVIGIAIGVWLR